MELITIRFFYIQFLLEKFLPSKWKLFFNQMVCNEKLFVIWALHCNKWHINFTHLFIIYLQCKWFLLIRQFLDKFKVYPIILLYIFDPNIIIFDALIIIEFFIFFCFLSIVCFKIKDNQKILCNHYFWVFRIQQTLIFFCILRFSFSVYTFSIFCQIFFAYWILHRSTSHIIIFLVKFRWYSYLYFVFWTPPNIFRIFNTYLLKNLF